MVFNLRQGRSGKFLEIRVGTVPDLILKESRISLLILDLSVDIVAIERSARFRLES
jgi:hypothetical protein